MFITSTIPEKVKNQKHAKKQSLGKLISIIEQYGLLLSKRQYITNT
jgi:hypothetical protein